MNNIKAIIIFVFSLFIMTPLSHSAEVPAVTEITGAGATFPFPLYAKWAESYEKITKVKLNYQSVGSGAGIKQIQAKTVDFGASDMPLDNKELVKNGLFQFPTVIGGVVIVHNLNGVETNQLKLTGEILAEIFLGNITKWNHPKIVDLNPKLKLPNQNITVVHRSDGSGTSFLFTKYLSDLSKEWKEKVGSETSVQWPTGVGGKGNEGVANFTKTIEGSIGYVEYAYATQNNLKTLALKNKSGKFVNPDSTAFAAAASKADWSSSKDFYMILINQEGKESWPITGATYILLHKNETKPGHTLAMLRFFNWAYLDGDKIARDLDYVPLPSFLKDLIIDAWTKKAKTKEGQQIWTKK